MSASNQQLLRPRERCCLFDTANRNTTSESGPSKPGWSNQSLLAAFNCSALQTCCCLCDPMIYDPALSSAGVPFGFSWRQRQPVFSGEKQVQQLNKQLSVDAEIRQFELVLVSPLRRALQTACATFVADCAIRLVFLCELFTACRIGAFAGLSVPIVACPLISEVLDTCADSETALYRLGLRCRLLCSWQFPRAAQTGLSNGRFQHMQRPVVVL